MHMWPASRNCIAFFFTHWYKHDKLLHFIDLSTLDLSTLDLVNYNLMIFSEVKLD